MYSNEQRLTGFYKREKSTAGLNEKYTKFELNLITLEGNGAIR